VTLVFAARLRGGLRSGVIVAACALRGPRSIAGFDEVDDLAETALKDLIRAAAVEPAVQWWISC
jgi:hypothetical protein